MSVALHLGAALRRHWPYYLAEAAGIAFFLSSASLFTVVLEHPASWVRQAFAEQHQLRLGIMGLLMGLVIVGIVYSPWGKRSGAHINPAVTVGFWHLGKISTADALWYVLAQCLGAVCAGQLMKLVLGELYAHPAVNHVVTHPPPGPNGWWLAFSAEFVITFVLMLVLLLALHSERYKKYTGWLVGVLLALYIYFETPYSGMSLNPARSLGAAVAAGSYQGLWIYIVATTAAAWGATVLFQRLYHGQPLACAVLAGCQSGTGGPLYQSADAAEPPQYPDAHATEREA
ncbi:MIP/aquaporin family protein [Solirubrum puertoriconensis]|uniref:MIP family channel protein n=1 Tax=Solirubrum puertoriconensis TaxID=1751427 RepID=A0A9X0L6L2_SOLP1|nr:aquaporin [Solirubrum puertoriconensis]KUG09964.1 hypothetical protein ASU33_20685 [Solirubrum puertoriconensis]